MLSMNGCILAYRAADATERHTSARRARPGSPAGALLWGEAPPAGEVENPAARAADFTQPGPETGSCPQTKGPYEVCLLSIIIIVP